MATATRPKKKSHTGFRNNKMFCFNCGRTQDVPFPIDVTMFAAMATAFEKIHKTCAKTWVEPTPSGLGEWIACGERGISSETMVEVITGRNLLRSHGRSHPYDPDDFRRCYLLMKAAPELREGFPKLAAESPVWAALVEHWDELTAMMEDAIANRATNGGRAEKMYERMKALGC